MKPIIKWAGGKRRLAELIAETLKLSSIGDHCYFEPFLGGGAVLFYAAPINAYGFDINNELMNFYDVVRLFPDQLLMKYECDFYPYHNEEFYYKVREEDRLQDFSKKDKIYRAARFIYLNKNCYNGLWRENSKGQNNCPWNHSDVAVALYAEDILEISDYLKSATVKVTLSNYYEVEKLAKQGDIVYFDPPYDKEPGQNGFTSYSRSGFNQSDQKRLQELCDRLVKNGIRVGISNANTQYIRKIYESSEVNYRILEVTANRSISGDGERRGRITELLIIGGYDE